MDIRSANVQYNIENIELENEKTQERLNAIRYKRLKNAHGHKRKTDTNYRNKTFKRDGKQYNCTIENQIRNEDTRAELNIYSVNGRTEQNKANWIQHINIINNKRLTKHYLKYEPTETQATQHKGAGIKAKQASDRLNPGSIEIDAEEGEDDEKETQNVENLI